MSEIVTISRPKQVDDMTGRTNVACFELGAIEVKLPSDYAFLKPGARMPVAAGEVYDIYHWARTTGSIWRNRLLISEHGEFTGPMAFVKKPDCSILETLEEGRKAKWLDQKSNLILSIIAVMVVWTGAFATYLGESGEIGNEWHIVMAALFGASIYALYVMIRKIIHAVTGLEVKSIAVMAHKSFYPDDYFKD